MNLYEQELRKIFGESKVLQNPQFCGKTCLAKLDEELRVKIQFESAKVSQKYDSLCVSVINRTEGVVDKEMFRISDILGENPNHASNIFAADIHIWECDGKAEWYAFQPVQKDYEAIESTISGYLSLYQEEDMGMGGQMM